MEDGDSSAGAGAGSGGVEEVEKRLMRAGLCRVLCLGLSCRAAMGAEEK